MTTPIDIVISFDTTGSMYSVLTQVRKQVKDMIDILQKAITGVRIALICHGDYEDEKTSYLYKQCDFTENKEDLVRFVEKTGNTHGFDYAEAYEYVLNKVQDLSWQPSSVKALVMIGDAYGHEAKDNPHGLDWRVECEKLKEMNIPVYSVQALSTGSGPSFMFWKQLASRTNGYHLFLDQFSYIKDILIAICLKQASDAKLIEYEQEMESKADSGILTHSMRRVFDNLLKRASTTTTTVGSKRKVAEVVEDEKKGSDSLLPCPSSKYQILNVPSDMSIKQFIESQDGLTFKKGKGFYEYTKPELIQVNKLIVLQNKRTGELFEGDAARSIAGITEEYAKKKIRPENLDNYKVFVQSTSVNRKLIGNTSFLYEAEDYGRE
jgi:hypothetical protein